MNVEAELRHIDKAVAKGYSALPLLLSKLESSSGAVRCAALSALDRIEGVSAAEPSLLSMLATDPDQDVITRLISVLSTEKVGSKDSKLLEKLKLATERFDPCYSGTMQALEDAALKIMKGLSSDKIVKQSRSEREKMLSEII